MELLEIIQTAIAVTGIINCLFVSVILVFIRRGNLKANKILSLILFAVSLKISFALLLTLARPWKTYELVLYYCSEAAYFSFGPLMYLYLRSLMKIKTKTVYIVIMFLPALSPFIGHFLMHDSSLLEMQAYYLIFLVIGFILIKNYYSTIKPIANNTSEKFRINTIYGSFLIIWIAVNFLFIDARLYFIELSVIFTVTFYIVLFLLIKFYWIKQGDLKEPQKYLNARISVEEENTILASIKIIMETEKLYTDSEISLPKVATRINVKPHKLSLVINKRMNMTFNEYINSYRINDIKNLIKLPEYRDSKIVSLAYDYGFNSLSVFNSAFKKFTNYTPTEYRNEYTVNI